MLKPRLCDVCGEPVGEWPEYHQYHEDDCPNFIVFDNEDERNRPTADCACDLVAHPKCCPQCNPEQEEEQNGY